MLKTSTIDCRLLLLKIAASRKSRNGRGCIFYRHSNISRPLQIQLPPRARHPAHRVYSTESKPGTRSTLRAAPTLKISSPWSVGVGTILAGFIFSGCKATLLAKLATKSLGEQTAQQSHSLVRRASSVAPLDTRNNPRADALLT